MWSKLEEVFKKIDLPYSRQGSYEEGEELPESFFTFWNSETPEEGFYDDEAQRIEWYWYVYFYTSDPRLLYSKIEEFINIAKAEGFLVNNGKGNDLPSDIPNYSGRYVKLLYVENKIGG